ncbi:glycoside hydrolase family 25 protein [Viscerimonas tarda]
MPQKRTRKKKNKTRRSVNWVILGVIAISILAVGYYIYVKKFKQATSFNKVGFTVRGVDLSHHNPIIDWSEVTGQNIGFVYMKATGGVSHKDRNYLYNYKSAKKSNIKAGSYHFYLFAASGKKQAQHFIKTARCESGDLLPAIDVEHSPDNPHSHDTVYTQLVVKELKALENELYEYYGVHPVIYTNKQCYGLYIKDYFFDNPLWICDLSAEPSGIDNWMIWQFSHKGKLDGIKGDIDLNYYRYSYEELNKILMP